MTPISCWVLLILFWQIVWSFCVVIERPYE